MKKALLVLILTIQFAGVVGIASAMQQLPWPPCIDCRVALK